MTSIGVNIVEVGYENASFSPFILAHSYLSAAAIYEIFASNAERFPDRQCVVETKSTRAAQRIFTYRQINESSNQLANDFLAHGCEIGDVVMIYAYRGSVLLRLSLLSLTKGM